MDPMNGHFSPINRLESVDTIFTLWDSDEFNFCPQGETLDLYANDAKSFPPGFFSHFGRPTAENYKLAFLETVLRPNGAFDHVRPKPGFGPFEVRP